MKKKAHIVIVMCLVLLMLSACGKAEKPKTSELPADSEITETSELPADSEIFEKNRLSTLLENNECVIYSQLDMISGGVCHKAYYKGADGENCLIEEWNGYTSYGNDEMSLTLDNTGVSMYVSAMKDSIILYNEYSLYSVEKERETLALDENGNYICQYRTEMDEETAACYEGKWFCKAGDFIVSQAVLDAQTLLVQRVDYCLEYAETGEKEYIAIMIVRFGQQPEIPYALGHFLNGETHTVTLTLSDGTVRSYAVPIEAAVYYYAEEEELLYADEAGTVPYEFPDGPLDGDVAVYCR